MKIAVFTGPTLSHKEASSLLDAIFLPPVKQGDLINAMSRFQPDVLAIIDGADDSELPVWHKDILFAIENGATVYGAGSVGALRAVEIQHPAMIGVGEVHRQFRVGELNDDDEVMFLHERRGEEWVRLTEPMVNLRATFQSAMESGAIDAPFFDLAVATAKSLYYKDRALPKIFRAIVEQGARREDVERLEAFTGASYVDVQKKDALELLDALGKLSAANDAKKNENINKNIVDELDNVFLHILRHRDRDVSHDGVDFPLYAVADYMALNHPEAEDVIARAKNSYLTHYMADVLRVEATADEIEKESRRFREKYALNDEETFKRWVRENDLFMEDFIQLMRQKARINKLYAALKVQLKQKKFTKIILDELRLTNQYKTWASRTAAVEKIYQDKKDDFLEIFQKEKLYDLVLEHMRTDGSRLRSRSLETASEAGHSQDSLKAILIKMKMAQDHFGQLAQEAVLNKDLEQTSD